MTVTDGIEWLLLALGVGAEVACVLGVVLARTALDRLHYAAAASIVGPVPIACAVAVAESFASAVNAVLVAATLLLLGPLVAVETARAIHREGTR